MLKFFRRIRRTLLVENKFSNYLIYTIGEIVLVMVGILLALQVNNWNENRKDRIKEKTILNELYKDFSKNLKEFMPVKTNQLRTLRNGQILLRNINKLDVKTSRDSVYNYGVGMFGGYTYYPSNGVVASLISSGDFKLIKNDSLRKYLVSWDDVLTRYTESVKIDQQLWSNTIEPYIIKNGSFLNLGSDKNLKLLTDPVFINMLVRKQHFQKNIINAINGPDGIEHYMKEIVRLSKKDTSD